MKILAIEHELPNASEAQFQKYAKAEALIAWQLHQVGTIRELYFRADKAEAILVLECDSLEEAQAALAKLPFVKEQLIAFELIPLRAYLGFARLFEHGE